MVMFSARNKIWVPIIVFYLARLYVEGLAKKRVCVIGAGRSGLAAIKSVADRSNDFDVIAFERKSDVGGLWIYTDSTDLDEHGLPVQTTVYKNLNINLPRGWMVYPGFEEFNDSEGRDKVPHSMFLDYMRNYTDKFNLRKYIKFDTLVTKVFPIKGNGGWRTDTWRVETRDLNFNNNDTIICDGIMICSGIYNKPNIPKIPGIKSFTGQVLHSRSYKQPQDFINKTVVLLGAGTSGVDIAKDLNNYAKTVYLSHRHSENPFAFKVRPSNVQVVRGVAAAKDGELILQDVSTIVADTLIYCTGFVYDFPFLDDRSDITIAKKKIRPLIEDSINKNHPSMCFLGLEDDSFFGGLCVDQSNYFLDMITDYSELEYSDGLENQLKNNTEIIILKNLEETMMSKEDIAN